jgi:DNA-binding PadR family transcriptional regulator
MSAKHALLGLLLERPAYPYELADRMQARLGPAWALNSGQLYQTIKRMEKEELIERVDGTGAGRRQVRSITDDGAAEFERWFAEIGGGAHLSRRPVLAKLALAGPERVRDTLAQIDAYELACVARLSAVSREQNEVPADRGHVRADHVLLRLSLSADTYQLEGELKWARHAHEVVSQLLGRDAIWPSTQERASTPAGEGDRQGARAELFARMAARAGL